MNLCEGQFLNIATVFVLSSSPSQKVRGAKSEVDKTTDNRPKMSSTENSPHNSSLTLECHYQTE